MNKVTTPEGEISLLLDGDKPHETLVVLGHGAGGDLNSDFMRTFAEGAAAAGVTTARFNFLYSEQGRKGPDPQPRLEKTFAALVRHVLEEHRPKALFIGGKSMGGRIASHV